MYDELYDIWKRELDNTELDELPKDFYSRMADYLKRLKEENRMLDKRTVKARLLRCETQNVKQMLHDITQARYRKLIRKATRGEEAPKDHPAPEEESLLKGVLPLAEAYQTLIKNLLRGHHLEQTRSELQGTSSVLRFVKDIPAIIGSDMKTYGPFRIEDVASLPVENAKILVKQGVAEQVEPSQISA